MAAPTISTTEYGYSITGGTDATSINSGKLWVKCIALAGNADDATAVFTSGFPLVSCLKLKCRTGDLDAASDSIFFGDQGVPFNNLTVTLGNTGDIVYIYLKF